MSASPNARPASELAPPSSASIAASAPVIGRAELEEELRRLHADRHRSPNVALFGRASQELLDSPWAEVPYEGKRAKFWVKEVSCELELRRALSFPEQGEGVVLLVGYGLRIPLDVAARVAKGKVLQIERGRRVAARFKASAVSPEVLAAKPLVDAILDEGGGFEPISGMVVDLDAAWRALLRRLTGAAEIDFGAEEQVVRFAAVHPGGAELARRLARWTGLRDALHAWLERAVGRVARIAWRAFEQDKGIQVAALAFALDAAAHDLPENGFLRGRLASIFEALDPELRGAESDRGLMTGWAFLAPRLSLKLAGHSALAAVFSEAERMLPPGGDVDAALARSRYLPRAFELAQAAAALALRAALGCPGDRAALDAAMAAEAKLRGHERAQEDSQAALLERSRMALRLLAWRELSGREQLSRALEKPEADRVPFLAAWYSSEGAFLDHARRTARGAAGDPLGEAIAAVVDEIGRLRDEYDKAFAHALPPWLARPRGAGAVPAVPIEEALEQFAVPFLEKSKSRKLLVLMLDGMAWPNACELLLDLEAHGFAPTKHQLGKDGKRLLEPMLAALPTVTDVSRSAFFAGKLPRAGEALSTAGDPQRFESHRGLLRVLEGAVPKLLLSSQVDDPSGGASRKARDLVASDERVVGLVLNAIDDTLRAGQQVRYRAVVDDIRPLRDLLQCARAAGRAILLVADHGHVPGTRLESLAVPQATGSRWRALGPGEEPGERELALSGDRVWRPRGKERVALLWSETDSYSSATREGEHGGASLAEVVAPAVFVAHEKLAEALRAQGETGGAVDELEVMAYPKPPFWTLDLPKAAPAPLTSRKPREPKVAVQQVALPFARPASQPVEAAPASVPEVELLKRSAVFKAMLERRPKLKDWRDWISKRWPRCSRARAGCRRRCSPRGRARSRGGCPARSRCSRRRSTWTGPR